MGRCVFVCKLHTVKKWHCLERRTPSRFPNRYLTSGVPLDLQQRGWSSRLLTSGFDPRIPTVWVLEGLLYYLEPKSVPVMLTEAAIVSAPGSVLVASIASEDFVQQLMARKLGKDNIMSEWKWGCPPDVNGVRAACSSQPNKGEREHL